jgi:predicted phosphodiesterase
MRLAVVADIHGNLPALEAVAADIERRKPDMVINLGDCVSGPLWPKETCELLRSLNWPTVRGNCDRGAARDETSRLSQSDRFAFERLDQTGRDWLLSLPPTIQFSDRILACHGTPDSDTDFLLESIVGGQFALATPAEIKMRLGAVQMPLVLCGHSHIPNCVCIDEGQFVLNPGSVGIPAFEAGIVDGVRVVSESGTPHARYAIVTDRGLHFEVEHHVIAYDHQSAVQRAQEANRPDLAMGLGRGMMR